MIKVNFIPEHLRKEKTGLFEDGLGQIPREVVIGIIAGALALLLLVHAALLLVAGFKVAQASVLMVKWGSMGADKKLLDQLTSETQALQKKMATVKPVTAAQNIKWAQLLNEISDSVPKGVWLREIRYEGSTLMIYGSAVSKMKNEMIIAGNYVAALKEKASIKSSFTGIDVDSIQTRENTSLPIADFTIKAKQKVTP